MNITMSESLEKPDHLPTIFQTSKWDFLKIVFDLFILAASTLLYFVQNDVRAYKHMVISLEQ